jgi:hypothetical protein
MYDQQRKSYENSLIFTGIAAGLSLLIFAALAFNGMWQQYLVFFVTLELGIFAIIGLCLTRLLTYNKEFDKLKDPKNYKLSFDSCPDYYAKRFDPVAKQYFCSNEHIVVNHQNPSKPRRIMKIVDENTSLPDVHNPNLILSKQSPVDKFTMNTLYADTIKTDNMRCQIVSPKGSAFAGSDTDPVKKMYDEFKKVPWTEVQSRCSGLYLN